MSSVLAPKLRSPTPGSQVPKDITRYSVEVQYRNRKMWTPVFHLLAVFLDSDVAVLLSVYVCGAGH